MFLYNMKFDNLKLKYQNNERYHEYMSIIMNSFNKLFKFNFGDDNIDQYTYLSMHIFHPVIGNMLDDDDTITYGAPTEMQSDWDKNGKPKYQGIITLNNKSINNGEIVITKLLPSEDISLIFSRFANQLAEVDLSQKVLVQGTRYKRIVRGVSESEKKAIDIAYEDAKQGKLVTIALDDDLFNNNDEVNYIDLFDPAQAQAMEYLSSYHSELCRRLYGLFGFSMQGKDKQAQVTTDELSDREQPSMLMLYAILDSFKEGIDKINETFGRSWSVEFSDLVKVVENDIMNADNEENDNKEKDNESVGDENVDEVERV